METVGVEPTSKYIATSASTLIVALYSFAFIRNETTRLIKASLEFSYLFLRRQNKSYPTFSETKNSTWAIEFLAFATAY